MKASLDSVRHCANNFYKIQKGVISCSSIFQIFFLDVWAAHFHMEIMMIRPFLYFLSDEYLSRKYVIGKMMHFLLHLHAKNIFCLIENPQKNLLEFFCKNFFLAELYCHLSSFRSRWYFLWSQCAQNVNWWPHMFQNSEKTFSCEF